MSKTGIILVPLNYRLASKELGEIIHDADPKFIFAQDQFSSLIPQSHHDKLLELDFHSIPLNTTYDRTSIDEDDPIMILYTSGTSGSPKGVLYSHKMLFWNSINTEISLHINSNSKTIIVMPSFHTGGWNVLLTPLLHHGGFTYLMQKFDAEEVMQKLKKPNAMFSWVCLLCWL